MIRRTVFTFLILALIFSLHIAKAQSTGFIDTFDDPALPGWEHSPNAYVENGVFRIEGGGFAAYLGVWKDIELVTHARRIGDANLIVRYSWSDEGAYMVRVGVDLIALYRELGEELVEIGNNPQTIPPEEWFELSIFAENGNHTIHMNGEPVIQASDPQPLPEGNFGFLADDGVVVELEDVSLFPLEGQVPAEQPPELSEESPPAGELLPLDQLTWVRTGGPPGGLGYDIRYNFDDPNIWYATDNFAGLHISTDSGLTWAPSTSGIPPQAGPSGDQIPIFCLTVDPHNPQIVWTGTDATGHIYKSIDGGKSWEEKDNGVITNYDQLSFRGFTVDPRSSDIVYAMGETTNMANGSIWQPKGGIIFKTTDGGENWHILWDGGIPTSSLARYMWIDPRDPDVLFVSTGIFDRGAVGQVPEEEADTSIDPFGGLGILKSTDGGQTWRVLNEENGLNSLYVGSLYMHPENPDILLAGTGHNVGEAAFWHFAEIGESPLGVYRTEDGGEHWTRVLKATQDRIGEVYSSVEFCPNHPEIAYAGTISTVYRSEDAGLTWTAVAGGLHGWGPPGVIAGQPIDMQCDPRDPDRIFANNYQGGNFLSEDGGRTWQNASQGYTGAQVITVVVDPRNAARVYASGRSGVWRSDDGGTTWIGIRNVEEVQFGSPEWAGAAVDPSQPDRVLVGGEAIFELHDGGKDWQAHRFPAPFGPFAGTIVFAPSDPMVVYAGGATHNTMVHGEVLEGSGIIRSQDGGRSWEYAGSEQFENGPVLDIAVDPTDPQTVFAATQFGVFKTSSGGVEWSLVPGLPERPSRTVAVNPDDPQRIFAGIDMVGFYQSSDGGDTWNQISAGLEPNGSHRDVVFDPTNSQVIYVGDLMSGVYRSEDGGQSWLKINSGLLTRAVTGLGISTDGLHLYAATNGSGVYRLDLNGIPPTPIETIEAEQPVELVPQATLVEDSSDEIQNPEEENTDSFNLPCAGGLIFPIVFIVLVRGIGVRGEKKLTR